MKKLFPDFIAGFDMIKMVNEDKLASMTDYSEALIQK